MADFLILGGGLCGCVVASRLKQRLPDARVVLVEAGPDEHANPQLIEPMATLGLHNGPLEYNYHTVPQKYYGGRQLHYAGGRVLSGSSSVNYGAWLRGDRADYDLWARTVGDARWSYEGQRPFMRRTEHHHDASCSTAAEHGYDGPIYSTPSLTRTYPLTAKMRQAYLEIGVEPNEDPNSGHNKGLGGWNEAWRQGKRQPAGKAYGLQGVELYTNETVKRIVLEIEADGVRATGAELTSGRVIDAHQVILCCGAIRSPQVLMLSGIGPAAALQKHGIAPILDAPQVGQNLHEHSAITQFFRIHNADQGLCAPHPKFNDPSYTAGFPTDYGVIESAPLEALSEALRIDGDTPGPEHPLLYPPRSHYLIVPMYAPTEVPLTDIGVPLDGSVLSVGVLNLLPTSRGSISLASTDPAADPLIDPNWYSTEADRAILRAGVRRSLSAFETKTGREIVETDIAPSGFPVLDSRSSNEEIDARVARMASVFYHSGGTASMGKVVDSECRVLGVTGNSLRVVDASVLPVPLSCTYMVPMYALAEQMSDIVADGYNRA